jgi:hypothetical protein
MLFREYAGKPVVRLIAVTAIALATATSAEAMSPAPLHQADSMITQVGTCGPGQVLIKGTCVLRTTSRQHKCVTWSEGFCVQKVLNWALRW